MRLAGAVAEGKRNGRPPLSPAKRIKQDAKNKTRRNATDRARRLRRRKAKKQRERLEASAPCPVSTPISPPTVTPHPKGGMSAPPGPPTKNQEVPPPILSNFGNSEVSEGVDPLRVQVLELVVCDILTFVDYEISRRGASEAVGWRIQEDASPDIATDVVPLAAEAGAEKTVAVNKAAPQDGSQSDSGGQPPLSDGAENVIPDKEVPGLAASSEGDRPILPKMSVSPEKDHGVSTGVSEGFPGMPEILVPKLKVELDRLRGRFCPAMLFAGEFLSDWVFIPPSGMHDGMLRAITQTDIHKHQLILGPRELGKTTMALIGELFDGLMLRRLSTTHLSATDKLAEKKLRYIIDQLNDNKALQREFGLMPGRIQRQDEFQMKVGLRHPTVVTWNCAGFGGNIRGERESRIVADDTDVKEDSPQTWEKNYDKLHGTIMGALRNTDQAFKGQVVVLGNYLGEGCTVERLEDNDVADLPEHWQVHKFSAIELGPTQHLTKVPIGRSVWPELYSTKDLMDKRRVLNQGNAWSFETEWMNLRINPANRVWQREMFDKRYSELPPRHYMAAVGCLDPTDSQATTSDDCAVVSVAKCIGGDMAGYYYLLDVGAGKYTPRDAAGESMRQYIGPGGAGGSHVNPLCDSFYIEDKSNKGIGAMQQVVQDHARTNNVNMNIYRVVAKTYGDKLRRAKKVVDIGARGQILLPEFLTPPMKKFVEQMVMFEGTKQQANLKAIDDIHDAFVWCLLMLLDVKTANEDDDYIVEMGGRVRAPGAIAA